VPVRTIGEQHVTDDLGWIPSVKDWLQHLQPQPWMGRTTFRPQTEEAAARVLKAAAGEGTETGTGGQP
jgi:hypothetical protein